MSIPVNDTLKSRNDADFPTVDGPIKFRTLLLADLAALATVFPAGTWVQVSDDDNNLYVTDGSTWTLMTNTGGGGGGSVPTPTIPADNGKTLFALNGAYVLRNIEQADIVPDFEVTAFSVTPSTREVGQTATTPSYSATANRDIDAADVFDGTDTDMLTPAGSSASGTASNNYTKTVINSTQSFTLSADGTAGGTDGSVATITWLGRRYSGKVDIATYNEAFVEALDGGLQTGFAGLYSFGTGDGTEYAHLALPTAWGNPTLFKEHASQLPVGWTKVATGVSTTNAFGVVITYEIWREPNATTAAFSYDVS